MNVSNDVRTHEIFLRRGKRQVALREGARVLGVLFADVLLDFGFSHDGDDGGGS